MPFTTYAQNFEDVMLWRALKHIERGCYVDVGAQHPVIDSVSKAFYDRGWRGVHVEPVPEYAALLREARPGETVLEMALSDVPGLLEFNVIDGTGLSTAVPEHTRRYQVEHGYVSRTIQVQTQTMSTALASLAGRQVHWLKIDVEGFEAQVLQGWDSQALRPWIIVVEATIPMTPQPQFEAWEPIVVAAGYKFVYFDGLNRFYVANEHMELTPAFASPPNVFDDVQLGNLDLSPLLRLVTERHEALRQFMRSQRDAQDAVSADDRAALLLSEAALATARVKLTAAHAALAGAQAQATRNAAVLQRELDAMLGSRSWRVTVPMRQLFAALRGVATGLRKTLRGLVRDAGRRVLGHPQLARQALSLLERLPPRLRERVRRIIETPPLGGQGPYGEVSDPVELLPNAAAIYHALKNAHWQGKR